MLPDCHGDSVRGERASGHYFNVLFTGGHLFDVWTFLVEYTVIGFEVEWVSRENSDKEWAFGLHDGMWNASFRHRAGAHRESSDK